MVSKTLLIIITTLFLGFSSHILLFSDSIPITRSLSLNKFTNLGEHKVPMEKNLLGEEVFGLEENEGKFLIQEGRMDLETTLDYPGTGANKNHDPKPPGTA
ncbi:hypothetical protein CsatB_027608 [Cannabis sativa]|uniref:Uncharacterized protein n=1 Tax=Cannabis sativa TaxID=3483 RepID=A0A7J6HPD4_CANSA|nr:uncharacterized protein LOC115721974 [Cannabis sativa]KAF4397137.1 hypothetical protein G4B88_008983 [Cannabis sativa]